MARFNRDHRNIKKAVVILTMSTLPSHFYDHNKDDSQEEHRLVMIEYGYPNQGEFNFVSEVRKTDTLGKPSWIACGDGITEFMKQKALIKAYKDMEPPKEEGK